MSTNPKIEIQGISPFKLPSGVFEVQIAISDKKPSEQSINAKDFPTLWKDNFHLKVENGKFKEILGSEQNPLPKSVLESVAVYVIVTDQFSSLHSVFDVQISKSKSSKLPTPEKPKVETTDLRVPPKTPKLKKEIESPRSIQSIMGERGTRGSQGQEGAFQQLKSH